MAVPSHPQPRGHAAPLPHRARPHWQSPAPVASPQAPYTRESKERAAFIKCKPMRHLGPSVGPFAKRSCGNKATPLWLQPAAPIGRFQITDICDWRLAEIGRRWKAPSHHGKLALAIACRANNGCHHVREHCRKAGKVAREIPLDPKNSAHGLLAASDAVEVTHWGRRAGYLPKVNCEA
jgi:hypothetical protein